MNYSSAPNDVRVDFFRESGKWYGTVSIPWPQFLWSKENLIHDAFIKALRSQFKSHYAGMTAICLEPYHEHSHPLMLYKWNEQKLTTETAT